MQIDLFATDAQAAATPATRIPATPDPVTVQAALFAPPVTALRAPGKRAAAAPLDPTLHTDTLDLAAGTFAALHAEAEATGDHPRVTLPSGLSGRVAMCRRHGGGYVVELLGFGVGDTGIEVSVGVNADVLTAVDAALRARPEFIAALRRRQAEDADGPYATSPLAQGRDRWLADLDTAEAGR